METKRAYNKTMGLSVVRKPTYVATFKNEKKEFDSKEAARDWLDSCKAKEASSNPRGAYTSPEGLERRVSWILKQILPLQDRKVITSDPSLKRVIDTAIACLVEAKDMLDPRTAKPGDFDNTPKEETNKQEEEELDAIERHLTIADDEEEEFVRLV